MFFWLSKILRFFLKPFNWIFFLFALYFYVKSPRKKKAILFSTLLLLFVYSNGYLVSEASRVWEVPPVLISNLDTFDVGIVLGGATYSTKGLADRVNLNHNADRVMHAVQLFKAGKIKNVFLSGGGLNLNGKNVAEAESMKKIMLMCGIPEENILMETASVNTRENALNTQKILGEKTIGKKTLLITSAFHMRRSLGCFRKVGIDAVPFSTSMIYRGEGYNFSHFILPNADAATVWEKLIDEWVGYAIYKALGYI